MVSVLQPCLQAGRNTGTTEEKYTMSSELWYICTTQELLKSLYISHDTQTTHWDSPVGARQLKQLKILQEHTDRVKQNMEV